MTTWPAATVPVFPAGYAPDDTDFDTWIQSNFSFLTEGVVFRARRVAAQALAGPPGGNTLIEFDTIDEDPYSGWSATATSVQPAWSWLAPVTGLYQVTFTFAVTAAVNNTEAEVWVSGNRVRVSTAVCGTTGGGAGTGGMATVPMAAGQDYVQATADLSTTGESTLTGAGSQPSIEIALASQ
jgi:hypothetical protein